MERTSKLPLFIFRIVAVAAVAAGALITFYLIFQGSGNNKSLLLLFLFVVWDLSPFAALLVASSVSKHWPVMARVALYVLMVLIAAGSTGYYWSIAWLSGPSRTGPFLLVPLISWLLMVIVIPATAAFARRKTGSENQ